MVHCRRCWLVLCLVVGMLPLVFAERPPLGASSGLEHRSNTTSCCGIDVHAFETTAMCGMGSWGVKGNMSLQWVTRASAIK